MQYMASEYGFESRGWSVSHLRCWRFMLRVADVDAVQVQFRHYEQTDRDGTSSSHFDVIIPNGISGDANDLLHVALALWAEGLAPECDTPEVLAVIRVLGGSWEGPWAALLAAAQDFAAEPMKREVAVR